MHFLTFFVYSTRKAWVYLLRRKDEVLDCFKKFKSIVENKVVIFLKFYEVMVEVNIHPMNLRCIVKNMGCNTTLHSCTLHNTMEWPRGDMTRSLLKARGVPNYFWD